MSSRLQSSLADLTAAIRAPFSKRFGVGTGAVCNNTNAAQIPFSWAYDNTFNLQFVNAAGDDTVSALTVNSANKVLVADCTTLAARKTVRWNVQSNGSLATQSFFIADQNYRILGVTCVYTTAGSVAGASVYVEQTPTGSAPGAGTRIQTGVFDLHATAATLQTGVLNTTTTSSLNVIGTGDSTNSALLLLSGSELSVVFAGTLTTLAGVEVVVTLSAAGTGKSVSYYMNANADMVQGQSFFVANRPYIVTGVNIRYSTKSSVAGLKLTVTKETTTGAPGSGTSLLSDNTNAGILVTQTANTTYSGTLTATAATLRMLPGDRLSLEFSGATLTALVGLVITVTLQETFCDRVEVSYYLDHIPGALDLTGWVAGYFWTADRDYEVLDIRMSQGVATGAAAKVGITADSATTAPGAGIALNTANSSAGFDLNSTANTVQVATLPVLASRFLMTGDRLSVKPSGTLTTGAGVAITVALQPR